MFIICLCVVAIARYGDSDIDADNNELAWVAVFETWNLLDDDVADFLITLHSCDWLYIVVAILTDHLQSFMH